MISIMVNKKLLEWIKTEEAQGYTEQQLRDVLKKQGYKEKDVEEAFSSGLSLHEFISHKGTLFMVILYLMLAAFILPYVTLFGFALLTSNLLQMIFPVIMIGAAVYKLIRRKLYSLLVFLFLFSPLVFLPYGAQSLLQSFMPVPEMYLYLSVGLYSVVIGSVMAFMFYKASLNFKKMVVAGVLFMSVIAALSAVDMVVGEVVTVLGEQLQQAAEMQMEGAVSPEMGLASFFKTPTYNAIAGLIISFVSFACPWIVFYHKREDKKWSWMLLYIIPVIVFFAASLGLGYAVDMFMKRFIMVKPTT